MFAAAVHRPLMDERVCLLASFYPNRVGPTLPLGDPVHDEPIQAFGNMIDERAGGTRPSSNQLGGYRRRRAPGGGDQQLPPRRKIC